MTLLSYAGTRVVEAVLAGDADMAILPFSWPETRNPEFVAELLCVREAALAVPTGHPLAGKRRITPAAIARYPLILPDAQSDWRQRVEEVFLISGLLEKVKTILEVGVTQVARRYVSLGFGIALFPQPREGLVFPGLCVRPVGELFPPEQIGIFWRRGATPRTQARLFADFLQARLPKPAGSRRSPS